jgi:hypothetical protein
MASKKVTSFIKNMIKEHLEKTFKMFSIAGIK